MNPPRPCAEPFRRRYPLTGAFSLIELLVVMCVLAVMMALVPLALSGKKKTTDLTKAAYDIAGALQVARTYATANNTYVWVGFFEEDISKQSGVAGVGRLVISTVASRDGTSVYDRETAMMATTSQALSGTSLIQIGKVLKIDNVHLLTAPPAITSPNAFDSRPGSLLGSTSVNRIGGAHAVPLFNFQYPLTAATAQYIFASPSAGGVGTGIVQFNPRGEVITDSLPLPADAPCKEIAIQMTHGTTPYAGPDIAAVDMASMTGAITIYRR